MMLHALHRILLLHLLTTPGLPAFGSEIIKGEKVPVNQMLYMASVQNDKHDHFCGGFLINEDFVVTAAHCDKLNPTNVVLGTHDLKKIDETMRYNVKRCKHPSYNTVGEGSDIMLLKLSRKAQLNRRLKPISLPNSEIEIKNNQMCTVAGWGETSGGETDVLQMVNVNILDRDVCNKQWNKKLPAGVICAGGYQTEKGFCQGDSGGPLVCNGKPAGVVSFNSKLGCRYPNLPNVYTDLSKYRRWIDDTMKHC
ncbi:granzyme-like protein 1 [Eleginops maclovinus]|uniref:granzyme-like protein 1 n=1 Tax=Eleginops maclovinus TaxID=56733 RepID=UPI00307FF534